MILKFFLSFFDPCSAPLGFVRWANRSATPLVFVSLRFGLNLDVCFRAVSYIMHPVSCCMIVYCMSDGHAWLAPSSCIASGTLESPM